MPQAAAGSRTEPPVSVPKAAIAAPAATAAPAPVLVDPVKHSVFHGLRAGGKGRSCEAAPTPVPNSNVFSLPSRIAPADSSLLWTCASSAGTLSIRTREAAVVRTPRVRKMSLSP